MINKCTNRYKIAPTDRYTRSVGAIHSQKLNLQFLVGHIDVDGRAKFMSVRKFRGMDIFLGYTGYSGEIGSNGSRLFSFGCPSVLP